MENFNCPLSYFTPATPFQHFHFWLSWAPLQDLKWNSPKRDLQDYLMKVTQIVSILHTT